MSSAKGGFGGGGACSNPSSSSRGVGQLNVKEFQDVENLKVLWNLHQGHLGLLTEASQTFERALDSVLAENVELRTLVRSLMPPATYDSGSGSEAFSYFSFPLPSDDVVPPKEKKVKIKQQLKTVECIHWKREAEGCSHGLYCKFAHGKEQLGQPVLHHPNYKTKPCPNYAQGCKHGRKCYDIHPEDYE